MPALAQAGPGMITGSLTDNGAPQVHAPVRLAPHLHADIVLVPAKGTEKVNITVQSPVS